MTALLSLPPALLLRVLSLLYNTPSSILSFGVTCKQAYQVATDDEGLWAGFVASVASSLPWQQQQDWTPQAWNAGSYRQLYVGLLLPYKALLQQRIWHTTRMPSGQVLVVDAEPPRLVGRSVVYKRLQGDAHCFPVFTGSFVDGQLRLECVLCQGLAEFPSTEQHEGHAGRPCSALLQLMSQAQDAAATAAATAARASLLAASRGRRLGSRAAAAAARQTAAAARQAVTATREAAAAAVAPSAAGRAQAEAEQAALQPCDAVLKLACRRKCTKLYAEKMSRRSSDLRYSDTPAGIWQRQQLQLRAAAAAGAAQAEQLPLPDIDPRAAAALLPEDLRHFVMEMEVPRWFRSSAEYRPLDTSTWLQPAAAAAAASTTPNTAVQPSSYELAATVPAAPQAPAPVQAAEAAAAGPSTSSLDPEHDTAHPAATLAGLWRGTYGSHGIELLRLQLLLAPASRGLGAHSAAAALQELGLGDAAADVQQQAVMQGAIELVGCPGVLLKPLLGTPRPLVPPGLEHEYGILEETADDPADDEAGPAAAAGDAGEGAAAQATEGAETGSSSHSGSVGASSSSSEGVDSAGAAAAAPGGASNAPAVSDISSVSDDDGDDDAMMTSSGASSLGDAVLHSMLETMGPLLQQLEAEGQLGAAVDDFMDAADEEMQGAAAPAAAAAGDGEGAAAGAYDSEGDEDDSSAGGHGDGDTDDTFSDGDIAVLGFQMDYMDAAAAVAAAQDEQPAAAAVGPQQQQHHQQQQQQPEPEQDQQELLLVGTKVTGDRNVPAGQVSFAVSLSGGGSREGARELLLLHHTHSDVRVNGPGTRPLVVKERYRGRAQIANTYFVQPKVVNAELIVFEGTQDCIGIMWKEPLDSFSLFTRVTQLPWD